MKHFVLCGASALLIAACSLAQAQTTPTMPSQNAPVAGDPGPISKSTGMTARPNYDARTNATGDNSTGTSPSSGTADGPTAGVPAGPTASPPAGK